MSVRQPQQRDEFHALAIFAPRQRQFDMAAVDDFAECAGFRQFADVVAQAVGFGGHGAIVLCGGVPLKYTRISAEWRGLRAISSPPTMPAAARLAANTGVWRATLSGLRHWLDGSAFALAHDGSPATDAGRTCDGAMPACGRIQRRTCTAARDSRAHSARSSACPRRLPAHHPRACRRAFGAASAACLCRKTCILPPAAAANPSLRRCGSAYHAQIPPTARNASARYMVELSRMWLPVKRRISQKGSSEKCSKGGVSSGVCPSAATNW